MVFATTLLFRSFLRNLIRLKGIHFILLFIFQAGYSQEIPPDLKTPRALTDQFMDLRFGMFIHWGPVTLRGTEIGWSRNQELPASDYDSLYKEFNPVLFSSDDIIRTAKEAGMKYFVITAKHHDGFCLWPSDYTTYDIASTPYKKDLLKQLAESCNKYGIKFCIYYSLPDWHHPNYPIHNPHKKDEINPQADMTKYISYMKNQLRELVTAYNPYMMWFDGAWEEPWTQQYGYEIYTFLKSLDKNLIINNRLDKNMASLEASENSFTIGDFDTPEQRVGNMKMKMPWESCITIANQWAWKPNDTVKPVNVCIQTLARTVGGNGNLLLNIGPMMDGRLEARQTERLKQMGIWLSKNGTTVYGTKGGPYYPGERYASTRKDNKIYLHVFENKEEILELPAIPHVKIIKAYFMNGEAVKISQANGQYWRLELPAKLPDEASSVIVLELNKNAEEIPLVKSPEIK
jgi:alpha-L-fucosidase